MENTADHVQHSLSRTSVQPESVAGPSDAGQASPSSSSASMKGELKSNANPAEVLATQVESQDDKGTPKQPDENVMNPNMTVYFPSGLITLAARECGHLIHPAHIWYDRARCPTCEIKYHLRILSDRQMNVSNWVAQLESEDIDPDIDTYQILKFTRSTHIDDKAKVECGKDKARWSYRKALATTLYEQYQIAKENEDAWDILNKSTGKGRPWAGHTAAQAVKIFEDARQKDRFNYVEETSTHLAHQEALNTQNELTAENGTPPKSLRPGQKMLMDMHKRKARRGVRVKWDPDVLMRSDADIDTVRLSPNMKSSPHKTMSPLRSILRANFKVPPSPSTPKLPAFEPMPAQEVVGLNNKPSRPANRFVRSGKKYEPGKWSKKDEDKVYVNTSFCNVFPQHEEDTEAYWKKRADYLEALHMEVDQDETQEDAERTPTGEMNAEDTDDTEPKEEPRREQLQGADGEAADLTPYLQEILAWEFDKERIDPNTNKKGVLSYWVRWKGCIYPVWCPYWSLADCGRVLEEFQRQHPGIPLPDVNDENEETEEHLANLTEQQDLVARMAQLPRPGNDEELEEGSEEVGRQPVPEA